MPTTTFFKLDEDKQQLIVTAALDEFCDQSYDNGSVNRICKNAGIPKGSFYQYFENKLDLYLHLMQISTKEKLDVFSKHLILMDGLSFIKQIEQLFIIGIEFTNQFPKLAQLGERILIESNATVKEQVIKVGEAQSEDFFKTWIESAQSRGEVDATRSVKAIGLMIQALMQAVLKEQLDCYKSTSIPMDQEQLMSLVGELLEVLSNGISQR